MPTRGAVRVRACEDHVTKTVHVPVKLLKIPYYLKTNART